MASFSWSVLMVELRSVSGGASLNTVARPSVMGGLRLPSLCRASDDCVFGLRRNAVGGATPSATPSVACTISLLDLSMGNRLRECSCMTYGDLCSGRVRSFGIFVLILGSRTLGKKSYICEIFDSKIWSWRRLENLITEQFMFFNRQPSVCIGDVAYWLMNHNTILTFDSTTETHSEFPGPTIDDNNIYKHERIVEYKGKLGFIREYKSNELWLWGLEDRRNYRWEIKRVVGIDKEKNRLIGCNLADMALMMGYRDQVHVASGLFYPKDIFPFRSDWEPVDLEDGCMLNCLEEMMTG
nr:F-box protein At5g49610-like [Ipomoea batatas]